jgi:beta-galactosidase
MERFKADNRNAFYGKALLIVQSNGTPGDIAVTATADGLTSASTTINCK